MDQTSEIFPFARIQREEEQEHQTEVESLEREERIVAIPDIPTADVVRIGQITWKEKADLMRYFSWEEKADLMRYFSNIME